MAAERQIGQHLFPLVVGMRADHHDAAERVEPFQRLSDFDFTAQGALAADRDESENQQRTDRCARDPAAELPWARVKPVS